MPLHILRQNITKMAVDAIVNAANKTLLGGGGVDGAIHAAAGPKLRAECMTLGGCKTGEAKITGGYNLPAKYVIHTVGPIYRGGNHGEHALLESCYQSSLLLAKEKGCESIAFPLISTGAYGYPKDEALQIATDVIRAFLAENEMTVYLAVFDKASFQISEKLFSDIKEYIDDNYVNRVAEPYEIQRTRLNAQLRQKDSPTLLEPICKACTYSDTSFVSELDEKLKELDESFSQMLLRKIDEKGITDAQCYKKANIDRKLFSKIRGDVHYKPSKATVIAFAVSLELSLRETEELLKKAGFALSKSNKFDVIIEYFISRGYYDIFEINQALFAFDQNLLGA